MSSNFKPTEFNISLVKVSEGEYRERVVVTAANRWPCGTIVLGVRHFCPLMRTVLDQIAPPLEGSPDQGFVDQWGNFLTRDEAKEVVIMTGQKLKYPVHKWDTLYSENLH